MDERFERFAQMAKEEFGYTVSRGDKQSNFEDIFNIKLSENHDKNDDLQTKENE